MNSLQKGACDWCVGAALVVGLLSITAIAASSLVIVAQVMRPTPCETARDCR